MLCFSRRDFLKTIAFTATSVLCPSILSGCLTKNFNSEKKRPNVLLILTDDQGYGDLGFHRNSKIKTPNLDKFAKDSIEFTQFYASPVCTPTRASLMTGRYNYRTRAIDTNIGRAMMDTEEITIAEVLRSAGYKTGIFGKWHLGDNYPLRTIDQGFEESIVHRGGGICQPSDPPGGNGYFDPVLQHNGRSEKYKGYCMDIYTDEAIKFIEKNKRRPFFVYLATNTPHSPLQVSREYAKPYEDMGLDKEKTAKLYGMVTNIDDNFGRLIKKLKELNLEDNTIVIFMSDNGPCPVSGIKDRYMAGLRGHKCWVYENGIRVPFFIRWPGVFKGSRKIKNIAANIDVMPTLLEACGVNKPYEIRFDGLSLLPLLLNNKNNWPYRTLFFQWHRGDVPELYRSFAVRNQRYKFLQAQGWRDKPQDLKFELFDISKDPSEKNNIIDEYPQIAQKMKRQYEAWFKDVAGTRGFDPPKIHLGTTQENPTILTRQDWRAEGWLDRHLGYWEIKVVCSGKYDITVTFPSATKANGQVYFRFADMGMSKSIKRGITKYTFRNIELKNVTGQLKAWAEVDQNILSPRYVEIEKTN